MPTTLKEVAKLAGVAPNTASSILTGRKDSWASAETRQRVLAAANKLGYVANRFARGLRTGRYNAIGLLLPDLLNPVYVTFARCIEDLFEERGYSVLIEDVKANAALERAAVAKLLSSEIDGMICFFLDPEAHRETFTARKKTRPAVFFGTAFPNTPIDNVTVDFNQGTTEAIEHLVELGHRRIAFVCGLPPDTSVDSRVMSFRAVLERHQLSFEAEDFIRCHHTIDSAHSAVDAYLRNRSGAKRATAIFALNDLLAIGTIRAALDHNISVPNDLSVIGVDDIPLASFLPCRLTTVGYPIQEMAAKAVEFLLDRLNAKRRPAQREVVFPTHLIKRASSAPLRS